VNFTFTFTFYLRINGAIPLFPPYAFLALTRTILIAVREELDQLIQMTRISI
jgi:hypothetical protein